MYCDFPVLTRCCFCLPLRRGILTFGYVNLVFTLFMVVIFSYALHAHDMHFVLYHGVKSYLPTTVCVALHCLDFVFNAVLIYGTHKALILPVRIYYYFSLSTVALSLLITTIGLFMVESWNHMSANIIENLTVLLASKFVEIYLIILVRSLLKKLNTSGTHTYDNQLHQSVYLEKLNTQDTDCRDTTTAPVDV